MTFGTSTRRVTHTVCLIFMPISILTLARRGWALTNERYAETPYCLYQAGYAGSKCATREGGRKTVVRFLFSDVLVRCVRGALRTLPGVFDLRTQHTAMCGSAHRTRTAVIVSEIKAFVNKCEDHVQHELRSFSLMVRFCFWTSPVPRRLHPGRAHTHTHTQAHTRSHTHAHAHTRSHTHAHTHTGSHTHAHTHTCSHTHAHTHMLTHTHTHAHTHTHMLTHTHTCSHTHAHTHTHADTHTRSHTCSHTHMLTHICSHTQAHTRTHTYTLTYTNRHTHTNIHNTFRGKLFKRSN